MAQNQLQKSVIGIVGCFQNGKSTFVNCLLDSKVAMTGDGRATTRVSTVFNWGLVQEVIGIKNNKRSNIPFHEYIVNSHKDTSISLYEIKLWKPILQHVSIIDTPGFNDSDKDNQVALNSLDMMDFVVFVAQNKSLSQAEINIIGEIANRKIPFTVIINCKQSSRGLWDPLSTANANICKEIESILKNIGHVPYPIKGRYVWPVNLAWFWYASQNMYLEKDEISLDIKDDIQRHFKKRLGLEANDFNKIAEFSNFLPVREALQRIAMHWGHARSDSGICSLKHIEKSQKENNMNEAMLYAERACYVAPGFIPALYNRSIICFSRDEFDESIDSATKVLNIDARNIDTFFLRAKGYYSKKEYKNARVDLVRITELLEGDWNVTWSEQDRLEKASKLVEAYLMKMECDQREGNMNEAILSLRHIIECDEKPLGEIKDPVTNVLIYSLSTALEYLNSDFERCINSGDKALLYIGDEYDDKILQKLQMYCDLFQLNEEEYSLSGKRFSLKNELQTIIWKGCYKNWINIETAVKNFAKRNNFELPVDYCVWKDTPSFVPHYISCVGSKGRDFSKLASYIREYFKRTCDTNLIKFVKIASVGLGGNKLAELFDATKLKCEINIVTLLWANSVSIKNVSNSVISAIEIDISYKIGGQRISKKLKLKEKLIIDDTFKWTNVFEGKSIFKFGDNKLEDIKILFVKCSQGTIEVLNSTVIDV